MFETSINSPVTHLPESNSLASGQPLDEGFAQRLLELRFTDEHLAMLVEKCKIAPQVLAQSGLFSLKNDDVARQFLNANGFKGLSELIGNALTCPIYGLFGNPLGYTVLNTRPTLDENGQPVFYEEGRNSAPRIGVGAFTAALAHNVLYSGFMVWSSSPITHLSPSRTASRPAMFAVATKVQVKRNPRCASSFVT